MDISKMEYYENLLKRLARALNKYDEACKRAIEIQNKETLSVDRQTKLVENRDAQAYYWEIVEDLHDSLSSEVKREVPLTHRDGEKRLVSNIMTDIKFCL